MHHRVTSVGLDATIEPRKRLCILLERQLGNAYDHEPAMAEYISRRKTKCFVHMRLCLDYAPHKKLGEADLRMSFSQIAI
jgi:hypothetical protein